jgi:hypothetical protein
VIENEKKQKIVAAGTLIIEHKFIHQNGIVGSSFGIDLGWAY